MSKPKEIEHKGLMFYFSDWSADLEKLTDEQLGALFRADMEYGEYGIIPDFSNDIMLDYAFSKHKVSTDAHKVKYEETCLNNTLNRRYGLYKQECQANGKSPLSKELWLEGQSLTVVDDRHHIKNKLILKEKLIEAEGEGEGEAKSNNNLKKEAEDEFERKREEQIQKLLSCT